MCMKDNEVSLQEKVMENTLRMQEMDIEIAEEELGELRKNKEFQD